MRKLLCKILGDRRGSAMVEFAASVPVLILLGLGGTDFGMYLLLTQKLQNAAFNVADLAARDKTLSQSQLDSIFLAVDHIVKPFDFSGNGVTIVTGVSATTDNQPEVYWQRKGAGAFNATSKVGTPGNDAMIPADLSIMAGETIIVTEVVYDYAPLFGFTVKPKVIHRSAYFKPRLGALTEID